MKNVIFGLLALFVLFLFAGFASAADPPGVTPDAVIVNGVVYYKATTQQTVTYNGVVYYAAQPSACDSAYSASACGSQAQAGACGSRGQRRGLFRGLFSGRRRAGGCG